MKPLYQLSISFFRRNPLLSSLRHSLLVGFLVGISCLLVGCTSVQLPFLSGLGDAPAIDLSVRQVEQSDRPGTYIVAGSTTLPDQTRITVAAVRPLKDATNETSYAILSRQAATVEKGLWQVTLDLWQVANDGTFKETWQLSESSLNTQFQALPDVTFMATVEPQEAAPFRQQIERQGEDLLATIIRYSSDGELYLQASKTLSLALPFGQTTPPTTSANAVQRSALRDDLQQVQATQRSDSSDAKEGSVPIWSRTDAPIPPEAYLR
ncbi:MAG: hypothetical protein VKK04_26010 [Synechococcales bacterium]|nr:hypothetical protein [Synechococcales bacterium]